MPREKYLEKTTLDEKKRKEEDDYWEQWDSEKENGVGCRCRCDTDIPDVEGKQGSCLAGESLQPNTLPCSRGLLLHDPVHLPRSVRDANMWRKQNG